MKIRIASDLHTEFHTYKRPASLNGRDFNTEMVLPIMEDEKETVLVLAGDICLAKNVPTLFFKDLSERFKHVVYIAGNHESYRSNIRNTTNTIRGVLAQFDNVHFLDKNYVLIEGVAFIGATLWTNFNNRDKNAMGYARGAMSDFQIIGYGAEDCPTHLLASWTPELSVAEHEHCLFTIKENVKKAKEATSGLKSVVVTHHGPSLLSCHKQYEGSMLNAAFYSELDHEILSWGPDVWIHGHTHSSHDYKIGDTRIVVNPKGYGLHPSENKEYNPTLIIEV